jgi:hypothetical protein
MFYDYKFEKCIDVMLQLESSSYFYLQQPVTCQNYNQLRLNAFLPPFCSSGVFRIFKNNDAERAELSIESHDWQCTTPANSFLIKACNVVFYKGYT